MNSWQSGLLGFAALNPTYEAPVGWVEQREAQHRPHDLLWGLTPGALPEDAPAWAIEVAQASLPVVVRRATPEADRIPVGLRGTTRAERLAVWLEPAAVLQHRSPEALRISNGCRDLPVFETLARLQTLLDDLGLPWGPTGAAGYELACGCPALHAGSDLDLLIRCEAPLPRDRARALLVSLQGQALCRLDVLLETPLGGVALADWAGSAQQVLLKTAAGPRLVRDPWPAERAA
ncbi:malonate decarboxylase holo-ACP synthase [Pseudomonas oryzihabitans]|uniref:malonate decarboxylase holo-ACP synthase n=1 Tax=Pseudomonas oryzihabitans TaxID=47885 RepID=UPI00111F1E1C|nr:malonate decarboxylase holo-ACP synthase [Pseudomonas psychrotolerans]QDD88476.1 phosphoribosyl-dephospho-CoA transferase [Pseudomonas psychrotolerans]